MPVNPSRAFRRAAPALLPGALLAALLALMPPAGAQLQALAPFGSLVQAGDFDAAPGPLRGLPAGSFCFADRDGDQAYGGGEPLYFAVEACPPTGGSPPRGLGGRDVRLSGASAGRLVAPGDPDFNAPVLLLPGSPEPRYADLNRDGQWSQGDSLYIPAQPGRGTVAAGDLRLSRHGNLSAGTFVGSGDPDAGAPVTGRVSTGTFDSAPGRAWRFWDTDADGAFGAGDVLYVDLDGSGDVTVQDLRVTPHRGLGFGLPAKAGDPDVRPRLASFGPAAALCFVDRSSDGDFDAGEPVYFRYEGCPPAGSGAGAAVRPPDVRLTGEAAGSQVMPGDSDVNATAWLLPGMANIRYADLNRDARWSQGDALYLHTAPGRATVTAGDVRLTRYGALAAGTGVAPGDSDLKFLTMDTSAGAGFDPAPGRTWRFWDADGNLRFEAGDVLYVDLDADGQVGLLDVRLSPLGAIPPGSPVRAGDPDGKPVFRPPLGSAALCYADGSANGTYDRGEPVYFQAAGCGRVAEGDVRLTGPLAGSRVRAGDPERNASTRWVPSLDNVRFYDADDSAAWSGGDTLYLHTAAGRGAVSPGDVRLTAYSSRVPGTVVEPGDDDLNLPTTSFASGAAVASGWRAWDVDGDGRFDEDDVLYLDADASGGVTVLDVRLVEVRLNLSARPLAVAQVPELQRTIETLEGFLARQAGELQALRVELEARNATLQQLQQEAASLRAENEQLQEQLAREHEAPERPAAPRSAPGFELLLAAGAAGLAALARGRRAGRR